MKGRYNYIIFSIKISDAGLYTFSSNIRAYNITQVNATI